MTVSPLPEGSTVRFQTGDDDPRLADERLSKPSLKAGKVERVVLRLLLDHERNMGLPTSGRFVFYEMEQRGEATKPDPDDKRKNRRRSKGWPPGSQDVTDALTRLRERGVVPWSWIFDEERQLVEWDYAATVADYLADRLEAARINPWGDELPPLILSESKATAGVLRSWSRSTSVRSRGRRGRRAGSCTPRSRQS